MKRQSGYLFLLKQLQSTLPKHKTRLKSDESLRKAARGALKIGRESKTEDLFTLLAFWSLGEIHADKLGVEDDGLRRVIFKIEREQFGFLGRKGRHL